MRYRDKEWLRQKYHEEGLTQYDIADLCDVSHPTIVRWMEKHNIDTREGGAAQAEGKYKDEEWLHQKYVNEKRSMADIAGQFGVSKETIKYWIEKFGIPKRDRSDAAKLRVQEHPNTIPDNEELHPSFYNRRGYPIVKCGVNDEHVPIHRLLAALLVEDISDLEGMHAHHKNGVRWDNRLENIGLLTPSEHTTEHHKRGDMG